MKRLCRAALVLSFAFSAGCSTITGWFSDDEFDPREPVELQKINEQVKLKSRWSRGVGDGQGEGLYKINPVLVDWYAEHPGPRGAKCRPRQRVARLLHRYGLTWLE